MEHVYQKPNSAPDQPEIVCHFLLVCFACSHIRQDTFYMCYQELQLGETSFCVTLSVMLDMVIFGLSYACNG